MPIYTCSNCNKQFENRTKYVIHTNRKFLCNKDDTRVLNKPITNETDHNQECVIPTQNTSELNLMCCYCLKLYSRSDNLYRHIKSYCKIKKQEDNKKNLLSEQLKEQINIKNNEIEQLKKQNDENEQLKKQNEEYQIIINNALLNDNKLIYSTKKVIPKKPRLVCVDNDTVSSSNSLQPLTTQPAVFTFDNKTFEYVNDIHNKFWFDGKEIVLFIGYSDHKDAIKRHISDEYKKNLGDIVRGGVSPPLDHNEKNKIYISEEGLYQLLTTSKLDNDIIKKFQNWVFDEILPSIRKNGKYEIPNFFSNIKSFYNDHMITSFLGKKVVYLGITSNVVINNGIVELLAKFGKTGRITMRDIEEHRKFFDNFKVTFIRECDNYEDIEKLFKLELIALDLHRKVEIKGVMCKELFTIKEDYTMDNIINILNKLIDNNPLKSIEEKNNKIKELESNSELEKLKSIHNFEIKKMKLEIKKLELENEQMKLKKHDPLK